MSQRMCSYGLGAVDNKYKFAHASRWCSPCAQTEKDRSFSWEAVCRVLAVIQAVADRPRSAAGRVGLLRGGVVEALLPCLGLPKPEVIRSALEVHVTAAPMVRQLVLEFSKVGYSKHAPAITKMKALTVEGQQRNGGVCCPGTTRVRVQDRKMSPGSSDSLLGASLSARNFSRPPMALVVDAATPIIALACFRRSACCTLCIHMILLLTSIRGSCAHIYLQVSINMCISVRRSIAPTALSFSPHRHTHCFGRIISRPSFRVPFLHVLTQPLSFVSRALASCVTREYDEHEGFEHLRRGPPGR